MAQNITRIRLEVILENGELFCARHNGRQVSPREFYTKHCYAGREDGKPCPYARWDREKYGGRNGEHRK